MKKLAVFILVLTTSLPLCAQRSSYWDDMDYVPTNRYFNNNNNNYSTNKRSSSKYTPQKSISDKNEFKKHNFSIAYEMSDYLYREPHMDHPIRDFGKKHGVHLLYHRNGVLKPEDPTFASLEFRYMTGTVDYRGWWSYIEQVGPDEYQQMYEPASIDNEKDFYMEFAFKFGQHYQISDNSMLWPYLGLGYRWLKNGEDKYIDLGGGQYGFIYQRTSHYFYMPLGVSWVYDIGESTHLTLNGEFDVLIRGLQNSHTSEEFSQKSSIKQNKGYGLRASVKLEHDFGESGQVGIFVEPFWRFWKIQNSVKEWWYSWNGSEWVPSLYMREPFNDTREYGLRVGVTF